MRGTEAGRKQDMYKGKKTIHFPSLFPFTFALFNCNVMNEENEARIEQSESKRNK